MSDSTSKLLTKLEDQNVGVAFLGEGLYRQKDAMKGLMNQIEKWLNRQPVYVVVELAIDYNEAPSSKYRVSGNLFRVSEWMAAMAAKKGISNFVPRVIDFSTDRNWTRSQASEV
jgi:hypothetical protein